MIKALFLSVSLGVGFFCTAQKDNDKPYYPEVGKHCPDFVIQNIQFYPKTKATLKDFRGKWVLLDFWNRKCGACIASFPHVNDIQKELGDRVQVILVGMEDSKRQTEQLYARYRAKLNLLMPCAFDAGLFQRFDYSQAPRTVLIDDKGIVQCLTFTIHVNEMRSFLAGDHPTLPRAYRTNEESDKENVSTHLNKIIPFNEAKPFAMYGNGCVDSEFLFRSVLTQWKPGINKAVDNMNMENALININPTAFFVLGADVSMLYFYAYFGTPYFHREHYGDFYNHLILELKDSALFTPNYKTGENVFCYSVNLPRSLASEKRVKEIMQRDLQNYFGFTTSIEVRKCPCWRLTATEEVRKKIKAKGGSLKIEDNYGLYYKAKNVRWEDVFNLIRGFNDSNAIFDDTGIEGNVDINLDCVNCILRDIKDLKMALQTNGLDLVEAKKEMQAIVVRDNK